MSPNGTRAAECLVVQLQLGIVIHGYARGLIGDRHVSIITESNSYSRRIFEMKNETNAIRPNHPRQRGLDAFDRKILGLLVRDANISYAHLGERIGLSAPAVHERVKRMRRSGTIRQTSVLIDPIAIGKPLVAFIHVDVRGWGKTPELMTIAELPEVEEVHSVAGDTCMLLKVRTESSRALEGLLACIYAVPGVIATRSYIVLSTHLERPVQPDVTKEWPAPERAGPSALADESSSNGH